MNILLIALAILCSAELVGKGPVQRSKTEKVTVTNATPNLLVFTLVPTKLSITNRYNERYTDLEYFIYELLPGQNITIPNLERSITDYDRVLWVVAGNGDQAAKNVLADSMMAGKQRDKKYVYAIPVGKSKKIFIGKKGNQLIPAEESKVKEIVNNYFDAGNVFVRKVCGQSQLQPKTVQEK